MMAAKSSSWGSAEASEICVYIQNDNHDKENIEDQDNIEKISSEESVNSQELEETQQKRKKCLSGKKGNVVRWCNDLMLCGKSLELAACMTLLMWLPVNYQTYRKLLWLFDHVNDSW